MKIFEPIPIKYLFHELLMPFIFAQNYLLFAQCISK